MNRLMAYFTLIGPDQSSQTIISAQPDTWIDTGPARARWSGSASGPPPRRRRPAAAPRFLGTQTSRPASSRKSPRRLASADRSRTAGPPAGTAIRRSSASRPAPPGRSPRPGGRGAGGTAGRRRTVPRRDDDASASGSSRRHADTILVGTSEHRTHCCLFAAAALFA